MERILARQVPGNHDLPRDAFADILLWHYHHPRPQNGERVRVVDRRSGDLVAEGVWEDRADQPDGTNNAVVHTEDGQETCVPAGVLLEVVEPLPRHRPAVLTEGELFVVAELLAELGAVYGGERLGELATTLSTKIAQEVGFEEQPA